MSEQKYIILVSNSLKRDKVVKAMYQNLMHENECDKKIVVVQPTINKVEVYHKENKMLTLIRSIMVLVVPVIVNIDSINCGLYGEVNIVTSDLVSELQGIIRRLEIMNGPVNIKGRNHATIEQLDKGLSGLYGKY